MSRSPAATPARTSRPQLSTSAAEATEAQGAKARMIAEMIHESFSHVVLVTGSRSWSEKKSMCETFNDTWREWRLGDVTQPVLLSGHCPKGADAMAELLWQEAGLEVIRFPADRSTCGRAASFLRNQEMVDAAQVFRGAGAQVLYTAFLDLCRKPPCLQRGQEQLMPHTPGHFAHGAIDCRSRARAAGIRTTDMIRSAPPAF